jgi:glycosyltransferase involved in cell wall biosynthesis
MDSKKLKILYIAKNIPTPKLKSNRIIIDIAKNILSFSEVSFLFPKERVPYGLHKKTKFAYLHKLKPWKNDEFNINIYKYIKLPFKFMQYWTILGLSPKGKKFIKNNGPFDLIHAHYLFPDGNIAYNFHKAYKIPYAITFRNQDKKYLETISKTNIDYKKARKIFSNASAVITTNDGYKKFLDERFNINCNIIPHGIEEDVFNIKSYNDKKEEIIITTVGVAIPTKNIDWVIQAVKSYKGDKNIKLKIVGGGELIDNLKDLAKDCKNIEFLGHIPRPEVLKIMSNSNIFALPSCKETFGMVYLEAAATNNAIIAFEGEGVWGNFTNNTEMLFCKNYDQFEKQLYTLISDKQLRSSLSEKAYTRALDFQWKNISEKYKETYQRIVNDL